MISIGVVIIRIIIIVNIIILLIPFIHVTVFFISMRSITISNLPFVNSRISWKSPVQENTWKHAVFWKYAMFMKIPEVQENARCSWKWAIFLKIWDVHVNLRCSWNEAMFKKMWFLCKYVMFMKICDVHGLLGAQDSGTWPPEAKNRKKTFS